MNEEQEKQVRKCTDLVRVVEELHQEVLRAKVARTKAWEETRAAWAALKADPGNPENGRRYVVALESEQLQEDPVDDVRERRNRALKDLELENHALLMMLGAAAKAEHYEY